MNWFVYALKRFSVFNARAQRSEYWYFVLFYLLIIFVLSLLDNIMGSFNAESGMGVLSGLFTLVMLLPSIAVGIRRLHDTNRSGWWLLIGFVPLIGAVVLLVFFVLDGDAGDNRFGPDPKGATA